MFMNMPSDVFLFLFSVISFVFRFLVFNSLANLLVSFKITLAAS